MFLAGLPEVTICYVWFQFEAKQILAPASSLITSEEKILNLLTVCRKNLKLGISRKFFLHFLAL